MVIFDQNVKNQLSKHYGQKVKSLKDYKRVEEAVNNFITAYLGKEKLGAGKIALESNYQIKGLPNEISIYRLVDKFLWLEDKLENLKKENKASNAEGLKNIQDEYNVWKDKIQKKARAVKKRRSSLIDIIAPRLLPSRHPWPERAEDLFM